MTDEEDSGDIINDYFSNIFSSSSPLDFEDALAGLYSKVSEEMNLSLTAEPTMEEI